MKKVLFLTIIFYSVLFSLCFAQDVSSFPLNISLDIEIMEQTRFSRGDSESVFGEKTFAKTKIIAKDRQEAKIYLADNLPSFLSVLHKVNDSQRKIGLSLSLTPTILSKDTGSFILMDIAASFSTPASMSPDGISLLTSEAIKEVECENGKTATIVMPVLSEGRDAGRDIVVKITPKIEDPCSGNVCQTR